MDKTAKKLKQKRRAEREKALNAIRQEQEKELLKRFEQRNTVSKSLTKSKRCCHTN